jgi:hypothetical protein
MFCKALNSGYLEIEAKEYGILAFLSCTTTTLNSSNFIQVGVALDKSAIMLLFPNVITQGFNRTYVF